MIELDQINNEDCLTTMTGMEDNVIDLTVTSPPYDKLRDYLGYSFQFERVARELYRVTKDGGVVVWIVNDATVKGSETGTSFRQALYFKECGFKLHDTMIWEKNTFSNPFPNRYHQVTDYMFILLKGKKLRAFNPIMDRKNKCPGKTNSPTVREADGSLSRRSPKTIGEYGKRFNVWKHPTTRNAHPAPFPVGLVKDHIISWSNVGDLIFDPFAGSGTVGVASIESDRHYILSEISEEYCEIIKERVDESKKNKEEND